MVFHPPVQIVAKAGDAGKYKTGLPVWNMLLRGFMAGAYIAMGGALATMTSTGIQATDAALRFGTASAGFSQLILGATFPVGLIIIVLTGAELFTGDAMLAPMAAFIHKISWGAVINLWIWVYIGNLIGSIWYAYLMAYGPFSSWNAAGVATVNAFGLRAIAIAGAKVSYVGAAGMWSAFLKAIGCNWLVSSLESGSRSWPSFHQDSSTRSQTCTLSQQDSSPRALSPILHRLMPALRG
jgi:formate/nitrite transporter FocA (FNT family)